MDRGSSSGQATKDTEESDRIHTRTLRAPLRDYLQVWCLSASGCQNHLSSVHACLAKVREPCRCIPAGCEQDIGWLFLKKDPGRGPWQTLGCFWCYLGVLAHRRDGSWQWPTFLSTLTIRPVALSLIFRFRACVLGCGLVLTVSFLGILIGFLPWWWLYWTIMC